MKSKLWQVSELQPRGIKKKHTHTHTLEKGINVKESWINGLWMDWVQPTWLKTGLENLLLCVAQITTAPSSTPHPRPSRALPFVCAWVSVVWSQRWRQRREDERSIMIKRTNDSTTQQLLLRPEVKSMQLTNSCYTEQSNTTKVVWSFTHGGRSVFSSSFTCELSSR